MLFCLRLKQQLNKHACHITQFIQDFKSRAVVNAIYVLVWRCRPLDLCSNTLDNMPRNIKKGVPDRGLVRPKAHSL